MTAPAEPLAVAIAAAAAAGLLLAWPGLSPGLSSGRARLRRVLAGGVRTTRSPRRRPLAGTLVRVRRGAGAIRSRAGAALLVALLVGAATAAAGPVAGLVTLVYAGLAVRLRRRTRQRRRADAERRGQLDEVRAAAADLRAGLPVATALAATLAAPAATPAAPAATPAAARAAVPGQPAGELAAGELAARVQAALALADRTGAPLADLLDRIEADARARDRGLAAAQAQAAGARATTWLLAGLPVAGMGLGFAIGADPLHVLLHTPVGAACATGAILLQLAGLAWSARLMRIDGASS